MTRDLPFLRQYRNMKMFSFWNDQHSYFSSQTAVRSHEEMYRKVLFCRYFLYFNVQMEKYKLSHLSQQSVRFSYEARRFNHLQSRPSNQVTPWYGWTWYNFKYDTLFVMNRRKQISIDVQSFIICLQIMVSSWCRSVHDFFSFVCCSAPSRPLEKFPLSDSVLRTKILLRAREIKSIDYHVFSNMVRSLLTIRQTMVLIVKGISSLRAANEQELMDAWE